MKPIIRTLNGESVENKIEDFLDRLLELHNLKSAPEMRKFLDLDGSKYKNEQDNKNDESSIKYVTIKSNDYTKKTVDIIRYVIAGDIFTMWIENVLKSWNSKLNDKRFREIEAFLDDCEFENCYVSNRIISFNIDKSVWNEFTIRCKRSDLTLTDGFKYAINSFVISK